MSVIRLKRGRERSVLRRHPWIFSGSVEELVGQPEAGATVDVLNHEGEWLARAAYSPHSNIRARIWSWKQEQAITAEFFETRLHESLRRRAPLAENLNTNAFREVHAESDGIPGLVVDRYVDYRVIQFLTCGVERWRDVIVSALWERDDCAGMYERSDVDVRTMEGLPQQRGGLRGDEPPDRLTITENGQLFQVDIRTGHKTGFYLDQRQNRQKAFESLGGRSVLDCFAYSGGFTIAAVAGGATSVHAIDSSQAALEIAQKNVEINGLDPERCRWVQGDVFSELRNIRDRGGSFDAVILDPPRFAPTTSQVQKAARGYKDINLLAFKLLRSGGLLFTFSCSGGIDPAMFEKIVAGAALDAGVNARMIDWLSQPSDHPVALHFPEGRYLKGLICQVE